MPHGITQCYLPPGRGDLPACVCVCRFREGRPLTAGADFEISYRDGRVRLSIPEVFAEDAGRYLCSAENKAGRSQSSAELVVRGTALPTSSALSILLYK